MLLSLIVYICEIISILNILNKFILFGGIVLIFLWMVMEFFIVMFLIINRV